MQARFQSLRRVIDHKIERLVLDHAPQAFDEDIVQGSASAVHADPGVGRLQDAGEFGGLGSGALISLEDLRLAFLQHLPQGNPKEKSIHRIRQLSDRHMATEPVDDRHHMQ